MGRHKRRFDYQVTKKNPPRRGVGGVTSGVRATSQTPLTARKPREKVLARLNRLRQGLRRVESFAPRDRASLALRRQFIGLMDATAVSIDCRRLSAPTRSVAGSRAQRGFRGDFVPRDPWPPENHWRWIRVHKQLKRAASRRVGEGSSGARLPGARSGGDRAIPLSRTSLGLNRLRQGYGVSRASRYESSSRSPEKARATRRCRPRATRGRGRDSRTA